MVEVAGVAAAVAGVAAVVEVARAEAVELEPALVELGRVLGLEQVRLELAEPAEPGPVARELELALERGARGLVVVLVSADRARAEPALPAPVAVASEREPRLRVSEPLRA